MTGITPHIKSKTLEIPTPGQALIEITGEAASWLNQTAAAEGQLLLFIRHTSASLTIQENADPDVLLDLVDAFAGLAPEAAPYRHDTEGPDDMPAHVKSALSATSLTIPVIGGKMALGTWQGIYLFEHRRKSHLRQVVLQFTGTCEQA